LTISQRPTEETVLVYVLKCELRQSVLIEGLHFVMTVGNTEVRKFGWSLLRTCYLCGPISD